MKAIQHLIVSAALVLSVGTAMAGTDSSVMTVEGFHALSEVISANAQARTALTDEQLEDIEGGRIADYDSVSNWPKLVLPYIRIAATLEPDPVPWKNYRALDPIPQPWSPGDSLSMTSFRK